ncbi:hypothetical protein P154DRAFT_520141 [Amniculicola lignicola CBS 123094]|uniref:Uncharacterized protein n=1 Tax=Amniculicola lignicola CBS 123094 TaxID=1392246 RepID=A0A6A5WPD7_9PLEO|nr:hypothetical protein P154DRAFT_520141 [Amniculicola lignicola CBS 123094]
MMASAMVELICFLLMYVLFYYANDTTHPAHQIYGKSSIVRFFVYCIGVGLGLLSIPWLYPAEINSLPMPTKGAAVATTTN